MIDRVRLRLLLQRLDWIFVGSIIALILVGMLFIFSASNSSEDSPFSAMTQRQFVWGIVGLLCFTAVAYLDYHRWQDAAWWAYVACGLLLVLVLLHLGPKRYGAYRWLSLFGIQIQPSEFMKLGVLFALARFLSQPSRDVTEPVCLVQVLAIVGLPFVMVFKQPDLGTALMLVPLAVVMMYVAGVPAKYLAILALVGLCVLPVGWFMLNDYQHERVRVFLDPGRDPLGSGWNKIQSEIAVGSGGFSGKGYLKGTQNVFGFLPRTVAPTDFIFSVIAEESGFVGSALLLALYATLVWGGLRAALRARDKFGRLLAAGVVTLLFFHVFVNMAMTIGLMPVVGIPLPLVSYGGSFMLCTMAGLGIVQSVYVRRPRH
jgi:rod shape determining protein RodA